MSSDMMLEKLVAAVCYKYPEDPTRPNVTVSFLKNGQFYGSVVRYISNKKKVVCKAQDRTLSNCLVRLSEEFLKEHKEIKNPITELVQTVSSLPPLPLVQDPPRTQKRGWYDPEYTNDDDDFPSF